MTYESFLYNLLICFTLSFLIGVERQYRKRTIGLRTTILVSLGSFLFVTFSFSVGANDISRIASQVVAGIGFLGAGVILKDGQKIRGLTTAATLWCDSAIGVLCAGGAIKEAILGTAILLFANTVLLYINKVINEISNNKHQLYTYSLMIKCSNKNTSSIKEELTKFFHNEKVEVKNFNLSNNDNLVTINYNLLIIKADIIKLEKLLDSLYEKNKIQNLELVKNEEKMEESEDDL